MRLLQRMNEGTAGDTFVILRTDLQEAGLLQDTNARVVPDLDESSQERTTRVMNMPRDKTRSDLRGKALAPHLAAYQVAQPSSIESATEPCPPEEAAIVIGEAPLRPASSQILSTVLLDEVADFSTRLGSTVAYEAHGLRVGVNLVESVCVLH